MTMRRLILFDIDGTLVWGGPARAAFEVAMMDVFGTVTSTVTTSRGRPIHRLPGSSWRAWGLQPTPSIPASPTCLDRI